MRLRFDICYFDSNSDKLFKINDCLVVIFYGTSTLFGLLHAEVWELWFQNVSKPAFWQNASKLTFQGINTLQNFKS